MDEKQFDVVSAEQSQGFFEALDQTRASGVVMSRAAFGMVRTRHINTGLRDKLELITQSRRQRERLSEMLLHFVAPVNLRGINGRDAEFDAGMQPPVDLLCGRHRLKHPPRAVHDPREFRAMGRELGSFHDRFAGLNDLKDTCCDYNGHAQLDHCQSRDLCSAPPPPRINRDGRDYFGFSCAFLNNAATSAQNWVNAFCSSVGILARAAASRIPARSGSVCQ